MFGSLKPVKHELPLFGNLVGDPVIKLAGGWLLLFWNLVGDLAVNIVDFSYFCFVGTW